MLKSRLRVAKGLPISVVILLILGAIAGPLIQRDSDSRTIEYECFFSGDPFHLNICRYHLGIHHGDCARCEYIEQQHSFPNLSDC